MDKYDKALLVCDEGRGGLQWEMHLMKLSNENICITAIQQEILMPSLELYQAK